MKTIKSILAIPVIAIVVVMWLINLTSGTIADVLSAAVDSMLE